MIAEGRKIMLKNWALKLQLMFASAFRQVFMGIRRMKASDIYLVRSLTSVQFLTYIVVAVLMTIVLWGAIASALLSVVFSFVYLDWIHAPATAAGRLLMLLIVLLAVRDTLALAERIRTMKLRGEPW